MNAIAQVALALTANANAESWARLAIGLAEQPAEIHLRGMIVMPEAVSLSEGALPARDMRNALDQAAHTLEAAHDELVVYVD